MRSHGRGAGNGRRADRGRTGTSIVEVLVALVLLSVGLLGVAGNGAIAVRAASAAARERRAAQRAADRVALLRAQGCAVARGGLLVDSSAALTERWTVGATTSAAVPIDVEVRWRAPSGARTLLLRSGMLC